MHGSFMCCLLGLLFSFSGSLCLLLLSLILDALTLSGSFLELFLLQAFSQFAIFVDLTLAVLIRLLHVGCRSMNLLISTALVFSSQFVELFFLKALRHLAIG